MIEEGSQMLKRIINNVIEVGGKKEGNYVECLKSSKSYLICVSLRVTRGEKEKKKVEKK